MTSVHGEDPARGRRVMWLLNHSTARAFEVPMLKRIGFSEVFLPKFFPNDPSFRSADVTFAEDAGLTIPPDELAVLNATDWYDPTDPRAWEIANRRFSAIMHISHDASVVPKYRAGFHGTVIWRAYGLNDRISYDSIFRFGFAGGPIPSTPDLPWLGTAYAHLPEIEPAEWRERSVFLPLALPDATLVDGWTGEDRRILFVCPDIAISRYYQGIYDAFKADFGDLPHLIGGAQPLEVGDPAVTGFIPRAEHDRNMQRLRAMFYHSREPYHCHLHQFEAIRRGMPLVFMAGGLLDRIGGVGLPGRCRSIAQARSLLQRLLAGDDALAQRIRASQVRLLKPLSPEAAEPHWRAGFARMQAADAVVPARPLPRRRRIAVILPIAYRGGSLRGAILLAEALRAGSQAAGEPVDVVFAHLDDPVAYADTSMFSGIEGVQVRTYRWRILSAERAEHALRLAGFTWRAEMQEYMVPDESLEDCDLWLFVSDRLRLPVLPLKPYVLMVFDYLQRYVDVVSRDFDRAYLDAAIRARLVLVTTRFTEQDALQYAGIPRERVVRVPMLAPVFTPPSGTLNRPAPYFVWSTNAAPHKNHGNALSALARYYDELGGSMDCVVTGERSATIPTGQQPHLQSARETIANHRCLRDRLHWGGELADNAYRKTLAGAAFLWHPGRIDNGAFPVVEAAHLGVPSLSSDYPAMREMDATFRLALAWMDPNSAVDMAERLLDMERGHVQRRLLLPSRETLAELSVERLAPAYWQAVRPCL